MSASWETSLPKSLQNPTDLAKIRKAVTQWSRIVAWSWTPILAFKGDDKKMNQEQILKTYLIETVKKQGQSSFAYESYNDLESKAQAELLSAYLKSILSGQNSEVPYLKEQGVEVTLSDVLYELSGERYIFTEDPDFTKMFTFRYITEYTGKIIPAVDGTGQPIANQYISLMTYPPRPTLSEVTVTEQQLYDWAQNVNTGGSYLPPSIYIPIAGT